MLGSSNAQPSAIAVIELVVALVVVGVAVYYFRDYLEKEWIWFWCFSSRHRRLVAEENDNNNDMDDDDVAQNEGDVEAATFFHGDDDGALELGATPSTAVAGEMIFPVAPVSVVSATPPLPASANIVGANSSGSNVEVVNVNPADVMLIGGEEMNIDIYDGNENGESVFFNDDVRAECVSAESV